jgi:AhpD family alkylhydroperoxidase
MQHVNLGKRAPKSYEALLALSAETEQNAAATGLDKKLIELVKIRSSQLNGCAFCLRMHVRDAIAWRRGGSPSTSRRPSRPPS